MRRFWGVSTPGLRRLCVMEPVQSEGCWLLLIKPGGVSRLGVRKTYQDSLGSDSLRALGYLQGDRLTAPILL